MSPEERQKYRYSQDKYNIKIREYQKIINLPDNTASQAIKFRTKKVK